MTQSCNVLVVSITAGAGEGLDALIGTSGSLGNRLGILVAGCSQNLLVLDIVTTGALLMGGIAVLFTGCFLAGYVHGHIMTQSCHLFGIAMAADGTSVGLHAGSGTGGIGGHNTSIIAVVATAICLPCAAVSNVHIVGHGLVIVGVLSAVPLCCVVQLVSKGSNIIILCGCVIGLASLDSNQLAGNAVHDLSIQSTDSCANEHISKADTSFTFASKPTPVANAAFLGGNAGAYTAGSNNDLTGGGVTLDNTTHLSTAIQLHGAVDDQLSSAAHAGCLQIGSGGIGSIGINGIETADLALPALQDDTLIRFILHTQNAICVVMETIVNNQSGIDIQRCALIDDQAGAGQELDGVVDIQRALDNDLEVEGHGEKNGVRNDLCAKLGQGQAEIAKRYSAVHFQLHSANAVDHLGAVIGDHHAGISAHVDQRAALTNQLHEASVSLAIGMQIYIAINRTAIIDLLSALDGIQRIAVEGHDTLFTGLVIQVGIRFFSYAGSDGLCTLGNFGCQGNGVVAGAEIVYRIGNIHIATALYLYSAITIDEAAGGQDTAVGHNNGCAAFQLHIRTKLIRQDVAVTGNGAANHKLTRYGDGSAGRHSQSQGSTHTGNCMGLRISTFQCAAGMGIIGAAAGLYTLGGIMGNQKGYTARNRKGLGAAIGMIDSTTLDHLDGAAVTGSGDSLVQIVELCAVYHVLSRIRFDKFCANHSAIRQTAGIGSIFGEEITCSILRPAEESIAARHRSCQGIVGSQANGDLLVFVTGPHCMGGATNLQGVATHLGCL